MYPSAVTHYQASFAPVTLAGGHISRQQVSLGLSGGSREGGSPAPAQQQDMCPPPPSSCELPVPRECCRGCGDASQIASAGLQGDHAAVWSPRAPCRGCVASAPAGQWLSAALKALCAEWVPAVWCAGRADMGDVCPPLLPVGLYLCTKNP